VLLTPEHAEAAGNVLKALAEKGEDAPRLAAARALSDAGEFAGLKALADIAAHSPSHAIRWSAFEAVLTPCRRTRGSRLHRTPRR
jgi:hypothetical protein